MYKRDIINFLFLISFSVYGIGTYVSAIGSPSVGYIVSIAPHLAMLLFYFIDILYRKQFRVQLNINYALMLLFIVSSAASLFIALDKGLPEASFRLTVTKCLLLAIPFHAYIIFVLYNQSKESMLRLTLQSLSLLLAINVVGYFALGISNEVHSIDGRLNFPFLGGFYNGASLLAIINLLLLHYLKRFWLEPLKFVPLSMFFTFNLALFFMINSRLTILVFVLVLSLYLIGMIRMRGLYLLSLFTIPILLTSGILIYQVLQLPGLSAMMQRIDIEDVTTFNGRAFLWKNGMDWLLYDQQGLFLGNGYKGHYFLNLIADVAKLWNEKDLYHMHLHSSSMEIIISQGVIFFALFAFLLYKIYRYYSLKLESGSELGAFFPVIIFLLFILQVDTFVYLDNLGSVIFSLLVAQIAINRKAIFKNNKKKEYSYTIEAETWKLHDIRTQSTI
jgi:hypothetical protein